MATSPPPIHRKVGHASDLTGGRATIASFGIQAGQFGVIPTSKPGTWIKNNINSSNMDLKPTTS